MKTLAIFVTAGVLVLAVTEAIWAQQASGPRKPGPEHQRLAYFVGKWTSESEAKPTEFGPSGKVTTVDTCDWFDGHFAVICHTKGKFAGNTFKGMTIMSYDTAEQTYMYFETSSNGESVFSRGSLAGDTWSWNNTSKMNGKPIRARFTLKEASPDSATYKFEMASGDGPLTLAMEGKQTRQR